MVEKLMLKLQAWGVRNILITITVLVALIVLIVVAINYLTTGELVVKTSGTNTLINVRGINNTPQNPQQATGSMDVRLAPGTYSVTATNDNASVQQVVTIVALKQQAITLQPVIAATPEFVMGRTANSLFVDSLGMVFIDSDSGILYRVDAQNNEQLLDASHNFKSVSWQNSTHGVGIDGNNNLFDINGTTIVPLAGPNSSVQYTDAKLSRDGTLFITDGSHLYMKTPGSIYKSIYTVDDTADILSISQTAGSKALVRQIESGTKSGDGDASKYVLVDQNGVISSSTKSAYQVTLSDDGKAIAFSGDTTQIFDNHFNFTKSIPSANINSPVWLNGTTLLYGTAGKLWSYNSSSGIAQQLADFSSSPGYVSHITIDDQHNYAYVLVQKVSSPTGYYLSRVSLHSQPFNANLIQRLAVYLPYTVDECSLELVNFVQPTIIAHGPQSSADDCIVKTQNFLRLYNANNSSIKILFSSNG